MKAVRTTGMEKVPIPNSVYFGLIERIFKVISRIYTHLFYIQHLLTKIDRYLQKIQPKEMPKDYIQQWVWKAR